MSDELPAWMKKSEEIQRKHRMLDVLGQVISNSLASSNLYRKPVGQGIHPKMLEELRGLKSSDTDVANPWFYYATGTKPDDSR